MRHIWNSFAIGVERTYFVTKRATAPVRILAVVLLQDLLAILSIHSGYIQGNDKLIKPIARIK